MEQHIITSMREDFINKIGGSVSVKGDVEEESLYKKRAKRDSNGSSNSVSLISDSSSEGITGFQADASDLIPTMVNKSLNEPVKVEKDIFTLTAEMETSNVTLPPVIRYGRSRQITRVSPLKLEHTYANDGIVHNWINRIVEYFLSAEPKIECEDEGDQKKIDKWVIDTNFREMLRLTFQHKYIYGNAALRWKDSPDGKGSYIDFIDPKQFDALRDGSGYVIFDDKGNPKGYVQHLNTNKDYSYLNISPERIINQQVQFNYQSGTAMLFLPSEVIHMRLNRLGDSWRGIGQIEPTYLDIVNFKNANEGFAEALQSIGYPRIIGYVGNDEHPPTMQKMDDLYDSILDLQENDKIVVPHYNKLELLSSTAINGIKENLEFLKDNVVAGLGGPKALVSGLGIGANRHTLSDQKMWLQMGLKMEQQDTSYDITVKILNPLTEKLGLKKAPVLVWQEVSVESLENKSARLVEFMKAGGIPTEDSAVQEYIRDLENLPEYKGDAPKVSVNKPPKVSASEITDKSEGKKKITK